VGDFELDTRIEGAEGRYEGHLSDDWEIWGPNGGYLAAIALRAAGAEAQIPRPASFGGQFLRVAHFAPVEIEVRALRRGRRSEALGVSVSQEGALVFEGLLRTAAMGAGLEHDEARAPEVPSPETLPEPDEESRHAFWRNFDCRWVQPPPREPERRSPLEPHWLSWHRFRPRATFDDPFVEAARSLVLIDTLSWPVASLPHPDPAWRAPNLDVTAWFHRAAPESEWLLVEYVSPIAEQGLMGTLGRVFSRDGRLLASGGAQLFCVPAAADG
jgi:acyl-CoA thioesterase-2